MTAPLPSPAEQAVTGDEMRDQLAAALMDAKLIRWREPELAAEFADALLPTVRKIAAEELRAAADELIREAQKAAVSDDPELAHPYLNAATRCRDRAEALNPS